MCFLLNNIIMKSKKIYLLILTLIITINVAYSQKKYKDKLNGKAYYKLGKGINEVVFFKDSTFYNLWYYFGDYYSIGTYKFISKDTVVLKSIYDDEKRIPIEVKESKTDSDLIEITAINTNKLPNNNDVTIRFFDKDELVFDTLVVLNSTNTFNFKKIKFDGIVFYFGSEGGREPDNHKTQYYNVLDTINNKFVFKYDIPYKCFWLYRSMDIVLVVKRDKLLVHKYKGFYTYIKQSKLLDHIKERGLDIVLFKKILQY